MYRNLSRIGLDVAGRQNEMIELALTNGFVSIEIDMDDMLGRAEAFGKPFACQFIQSCNVQVGVFELPIDFSANDEKYAKAISKIGDIIELAEAVEAKACYVVIQPSHDELPFHENFEKQRGRIVDVAGILGEKGISIGLALNAMPKAKAEKENQFIVTVEEMLTFVKAIGLDNVGLVVDGFHWALGGGTSANLDAVGANKIISVLLSDVCSQKEAADVAPSDRIMPATQDGSLCKSIYQWLDTNKYEGPVAVCVSSGHVNNMTPQKIVENFKVELDKFDGSYIEPEAPEEPAESEAVAAEG